jgi:hypothetical protein
MWYMTITVEVNNLAIIYNNWNHVWELQVIAIYYSLLLAEIIDNCELLFLVTS